jgi:poly(3-hydroxybutyrate) depolymerase
MRPTWSIVFAAGALVAIFACSSSTGGTVGDVGPESGTPDDDAGTTSSSGTTSSGGSSSGTPSQDGGADAGPQWTFKSTTVKLQHWGVERYYIVREPSNYDANKAYPLVVFLHGNPSSAEWSATYTRYELNVSHYEAIVVYPDAATADWDHGAALEDNADSTFIFETIDKVKASHNIDASKILLTGWSGGGFMSAAMGCRHSGSFKAIGIHAGGAPYDPNGGAAPTCDGAEIHTFVTHGGQDFAVGPTSGFYAVDRFAGLNGCDDTQTAVAPAPCKKYDNCNKSTIYCYDDNWGHGLWDGALTAEWAWFKALP